VFELAVVVKEDLDAEPVRSGERRLPSEPLSLKDAGLLETTRAALEMSVAI
jgi:hypothetical protein